MSVWIRTQDELAAFVASLDGGALALDTESDSLYHHLEKVCLIQLKPAGGPARLLDPLAGRELSALAPVLADPAVTKLLHGADYDVTTLKRDFGFEMAGLFDSMLAAKFLGYPQIGLKDVLMAELGVEVTKGGQKDDWSRRPLTEKQEAYALADVAHLHPLHERLVGKLEAVGRLSWVLEECAAVAALPAARRRVDAEAYQKIKGSNQLPPRGLALLRELYAWRERRAEATNIPPFKIVQNETLLALAAAPPANVAAPEMARFRRDAPAVMEVVTRALALPEAELPKFVKTPWPVVDNAVKKRIEKLKAVRDAVAAEWKVDPSVVLAQKLMDRIAVDVPRTVEDLGKVEGVRRWRVEAIGGKILAAL